MHAFVILLTLAIGQEANEKWVSEEEKKEFLGLLVKLPTKGEFFTKDAVKKAVPYTRVLLALTKEDLAGHDMYPIFALCAGLTEEKESRQFGVANFSKIAHPNIKLAWSIGVFNIGEANSEIMSFLQKSLESKVDAKFIKDALGPGFEEFKDRVLQTAALREELKIELVTQHSAKVFGPYNTGFDYSNKSCIFVPGRQICAVRPLNQQGELTTYSIGDGKKSTTLIAQPDGFKAKYDFETYFDSPVLSVNSLGDLFCRWTIEGNGDHAIALLKKGSESFKIKRLKKVYLDRSLFVANQDGNWFLIAWSGDPNFTVYQIDKDLNLSSVGQITRKGHHSVDILDARFISKNVLHLFWAEVFEKGNHLRMRCVDFDVQNPKWSHNREIYRLNKFVSSANRSTTLQLKDRSLHYLWGIDEGEYRTDSTGLYYQSEMDGKTIKVSSGYSFRANSVGNCIVVCYTTEDSPELVFFRVIRNGILGPVSEIAAAKGRKHELWSEDMILSSESDRIWFVNTLDINTQYELKIVDAKKR